MMEKLLEVEAMGRVVGSWEMGSVGWRLRRRWALDLWWMTGRWWLMGQLVRPLGRGLAG